MIFLSIKTQQKQLLQQQCLLRRHSLLYLLVDLSKAGLTTTQLKAAQT